MNGRTIFGFAVVVCTLALPLPSDAQRPEIADTENKAALKIKDRSWGTDIQTIRCIALSPDNKKILIAPSKFCCGFDSGDVQQWDKLKVWDLAQQKETLTLTGHKIPLEAVAFSRDGKKAVAAGGDYIAAGVARKSHVTVWDLQTGALIKRFEVDGSLRELAPSGNFLLTTSDASDKVRRVIIYDVDSDCKKVFSLDFPALEFPFPWAVSPDGSTLAAIRHESGTLQLWNVATGKESMRFDLSADKGLELNGYPFLSLSFSRDGKTLCGQGVGTYCWSIPEKKWLHLECRRGFALSGDGHYLLSNEGSDFGDFTLISLKSGKRVAELGRVSRDAFALAADATVAVAVVGGPEARIHVWDLPKNLPE